MRQRFIIYGIFFFLLVRGLPAYATDFVEDSSGNSGASGSNSNSNFDPFSDYSEFEEGSEEEADLNFFHNGRFFSIGIEGGYQTWTGNLQSLYTPSATYGIFLNYFFNLRSALYIAYITADHGFYLPVPGVATFTGDVSIQQLQVGFKYYLNTQNVTRGLAAVNPYLIGGFGDYFRTTTISGGSTGYVKDTSFGVQGGLGVEIPISRNSAFIGIQATYNYTQFPDENAQYVIGTTQTGVAPSGDAIDVLGLLGVNF